MKNKKAISSINNIINKIGELKNNIEYLEEELNSINSTPKLFKDEKTARENYPVTRTVDGIIISQSKAKDAGVTIEEARNAAKETLINDIKSFINRKK